MQMPLTFSLSNAVTVIHYLLAVFVIRLTAVDLTYFSSRWDKSYQKGQTDESQAWFGDLHECFMLIRCLKPQRDHQRAYCLLPERAGKCWRVSGRYQRQKDVEKLQFTQKRPEDAQTCISVTYIWYTWLMYRDNMQFLLYIISYDECLLALPGFSCA